jgi:hypothetical protein
VGIIAADISPEGVFDLHVPYYLLRLENISAIQALGLASDTARPNESNYFSSSMNLDNFFAVL